MSMSEFLGKTLGQYRIETPIDAGAMGQVYRGVHIYLNRPAAIKVMRAHLVANPRFRDRFLQEARSAAALKHQNIVDIYEFGEQDGQLYLVMELVPDGTLRSLLNRRSKQPWSLTQGLHLMKQAAEGLAAAHAQSVIHRDIKPDNMLLMRLNTQSDQYQLKISDFGLARLAEGSGLTATGVPMGTLAYMSPEQCIGGQLDGRTDLYSLGVVIYEVVTGYLPFQIESFDDALRKHTQVPPTPPSQVRPGIPAALDTIILRCLAKKPADRYQTGTELARDLQAVINSNEVETIGSDAGRYSNDSLVSVNNTAVRTTNPGNTVAPVVVTLQGYADQPRVRVLDEAGQTLQVAELTNRSIIVGRQAGNAIVLQSDKISRQHVQIQWDGRQVTVKDLGSSNGTLLDSVRLQPDINYPWADRQLVHIGPFWLRLEGSASGAASDVTRLQPVQHSLPPTALASVAYAQQQQLSNTYTVGSGGRIGIQVEPRNLSLTPGQPANVRVTLTNLGVLVDWLTITVEGVPSEWVNGPANEVQLNPGMQETVDLGINVAKASKNHARDYPVIVRARSREKPSESGTAPGLWTVKPFKDNALRVDPRRVSGRGTANYTVTVINNGNLQTDYVLSGEDDEQKLSYRFNKDTLSLEPGREVKVPFVVGGQRRWIGREQNQRFQIHSQVNGDARALSSNAEFVNKALIPPWLLTAVSALLAFSILLGTLSALLHKSPTDTAMSVATNPLGTLKTIQMGGGQATQTTQMTAPPNSVPPMALKPTATTTTTNTQPMQGMAPPATTQNTTNAFIQQATTTNSNKNFTAINATLTNNKPNAAVFVTQNVTPNGNGQVFNAHAEGVWFDQTNWAVFNEDNIQMTQQAAFNVWIPKKTQTNFIQQATTANIAGGSTVIDNPLVNNKPNAVLFVTQNWNPGGNGGVFNPHPIGVAFNNGSWAIFNEDGAAMTPQASFNVHVLTTGNTTFEQTASNTNMTNGATIIDNAIINNDAKAIIIVTQIWNANGATNGVYNPHPIAVEFNGTNWEIVNEDQTPIPQGASFNVTIIQK